MSNSAVGGSLVSIIPCPAQGRPWGEALTQCSSPWTQWCCPPSPCWLRGWQSHGAAHPTRRTGCPCRGSSGPRRTACRTGPSCPETPQLCRRRLEHRTGIIAGWWGWCHPRRSGRLVGTLKGGTEGRDLGVCPTKI